MDRDAPESRAQFLLGCVCLILIDFYCGLSLQLQMGLEFRYAAYFSFTIVVAVWATGGPGIPSPSAFGAWINKDRRRFVLGGTGMLASVFFQIFVMKAAPFPLREIINALQSSTTIAYTFMGTVFVAVLAAVVMVMYTLKKGDGPGFSTFWKLMFLLPLLFASRSYMREHFIICDLEFGKEYLSPNIDKEAAEVSTFLKELVINRAKTNNNTALRDVHPKAHGCLHGVFKVNEVEDERLKHGIFAQAGTEYNMWIRFSNGDGAVKSDVYPDVRGAAIKLVDVPGKKLLGPKDDPEQNTQDFILISSDTFILSDTSQYINFLKGVDNPVNMPAYLFPSLYDPTTWNLRTLYKIFSLFYEGWRIRNPLISTFYSAVPYRLGTPDQAVKYRITPCTPSDGETPQFEKKYGPNYIRDNMIRQLTEETACYHFQVMLQSPTHEGKGRDMACINPTEDSTLSWVGVGADPIEWFTVGTIDIPSQSFNSSEQMKFCRDLTFSPWHTISAHEPLGGLNRVRKATYLATGETRSKINGVIRGSVSGTRRFGEDAKKKE